MSQRDSQYIGRAGEFLAAFLLETNGLRTTHVDIPGDDLWCAHPSGRVYRVQVKSSLSSRNFGGRHAPSYTYNIRSRETYSGVYVFVAIDKMLCIARRWDDTPPSTVRYQSDAFTPEVQIETIKREFSL